MFGQAAVCRWVLAGGLVCGAWGPCGCRKEPPPDLVIVSPHHNNAQAEFEHAFRAWHRGRFGADVKIEWRGMGGTSAITRTLVNLYARADSSGIDLYFGGGGPDHKYLKAKGIIVPVQLPAEILAALPERIGQVRQRDPDGHWYAAAVSCFGILYNAKLLKANKLPVPRRWDDLASPALFRRIETADPTESGSARAAYEMIVQSAADWPRGWAKLLKIYANSRRFVGGASDVVADVAHGEVLAGAAIDFYAFTQIAHYGQDLGFSLVPDTTAYTPDPISMLKGAPHPATAGRFIEFVLSLPGQAIWCLPAGDPDGPRSHSLYRQPVRRDAYEKYAGRMLAPLVNPFAQAGTFQLDEAAAGVRISRLHGPLMKAAAKDSAEQLSRAWKAIIDAGQPADLVAELVALPADLADEKTALATAVTLADPKRRSTVTLAWQRFFRSKYERILAKAGR